MPALIQPNAPLDVVEGFVWGHEMQWGYYKHPPLQAWLLQLVTHVFGNSGFGYFGLSALCTAIALWAIYRTGRLFASRTKALIATLLCEGILYFNFLATEFNPNVLQLMTWALASYAFAKAILQDKLKYWMLLGVFFALGCYAKYSIVLLGIGFGLFILAQKETRYYLASYKPYLSLVLSVTMTVALLFPHTLWLFEHDFLPFTYAISRSEEAATWLDRLYFPLKFTLSQILDMVPMFALASMLFNVKHPAPRQANLRKRLLTLLAFAPLVLSFVLFLLTGHKPLDMWGMPYLSFIPLWIVVNAPMEFSKQKLAPFSIAWGCVFTLALSAFYFSVVLAPSYGFKPIRGHFPGAELSRLMHQKWQEATGQPLTFIVSDSWVGGNIALYAPDIHKRPHVFIDGDTANSPWINTDDLVKKGALVVWKDRSEKPGYLANIDTKIESMDIPWQTVTKMPPPRFYWAIIKPQ